MSDTTRKIMQALTSGAQTVAQAASAGAKVVARAASSGVKTVKFKLDELGTNSKRRDLMNELGKVVYELSQNGEELPLAATGLTQQIQELDKSLDQLRADHAAQKAEAAAIRAAEKEARTMSKAAAEMNAPQAPADETELVSSADQDAEDEKPEIPTLNV